MNSFGSLKELENQVRKDVNKALKTEVKEEVYSAIRESIDEVVYKSYAPRVYKRNPAKFKADKNMRSYTYASTNTLYGSYTHMAKTSEGKDLTSLIIEGQSKSKGLDGVANYTDAFIEKAKRRGVTYSNSFWKPRDYMTHAFSKIQREGRIERAFAKGMERWREWKKKGNM